MTRGEILYMESGQVQMTEEGLAISSFRDLYESDKNKGKPLFKKYIDAIWTVYSKDAPNYYSTSELDRISHYNEKHSGKKGWGSLVKDQRFNDCVKAYIEISKTRYDIQYEKLMDDIDREIEYLQNMPLEITVKQTVEIENEDGSVDKVFKDVKIPNSEQRRKSHKAIKELFAMQDELKERIKQENKTIIKKYVRIFDNPKVRVV